MGTIFVDNIKEHSASNGVHIPGHIIQVVKHGPFTNAHVTTTSSSFTSMGSAFSLTITPRFNNSLILIEAMLNPYTSGSNNSGLFNIHNGSSFLGHSSNGFGVTPTHGTASGTYSHYIIHASDTVSSTSTITYQIYHRSDNNGITFYGNHSNMSNHITAMEVAQ